MLISNNKKDLFVRVSDFEKINEIACEYTKCHLTDINQ